ncbi:MAG: hypothetical protein M1510_11465 [Nitrospirae bacterium]|nr:hypothetical protein [Nitrospirota bacterium]MCL5236330.1 hypothetical protein [Nitrospirota bacterium]
MRTKRRTGNRLPPFVALTWEMLNSKAYKALPASAGKALPYFLGKVKTTYNDPQKYDMEFSFSYTEAKKYGFATTTHHRTICELMKKGFIDPFDKGGKRSDHKSYNLFTLSRRWEDYGKPGFKEMEWATFQPRVF